MRDEDEDRGVRSTIRAAVVRGTGWSHAARRRGATSAHATGRSRRIAVGIGVVYIVAVLFIGLWGSPVDAGVDPLLTRVIAAAQRHGAPPWVDYATVESLSNVAFFLPLGLLVVLLMGARWWWAGAAAGLVLSTAIETAQALFLPARTATIDDVLANTLGATLGAVIGIVALGWAARRRATR
ncbi:VanZ family protein [Curtobacterium sp. ISL-83]|uniref:VanZ family protein n=1 Tax=Curtobacterium sp. ISL-83 TaxID=2819145 RepID=UPI001BE4ECB3|nr:VanZ family protein [Curtobacterium sp. ISL-83]MBT2502724.1 VanZ family protein [Curtobacterium sp. ISL-83]